MSSLIVILETLGRESRWRYAPHQEVERLLIREQADPQMRLAVLTGDRRRLETQLGAVANVCCMIHAPDDDDEQKEQDAPDVPDRDDEPDQEPRSPRNRGCRAASAA
jgi:hypothetical protein